jgi:hypothetical protein
MWEIRFAPLLRQEPTRGNRHPKRRKSMTGLEFENQFAARCTPMTVNATLPAVPPFVPAMLWACDSTHHVTAMYCGCADAKVVRNGRDAYAVCEKHHLQPIGKSRRIRRNHVYARAVIA